MRRRAAAAALRTCGWNTMKPLSYGIHSRSTWSNSRSTIFLVIARWSAAFAAWRSLVVFFVNSSRLSLSLMMSLPPSLNSSVRSLRLSSAISLMSFFCSSVSFRAF